MKNYVHVHFQRKSADIIVAELNLSFNSHTDGEVCKEAKN